MEPLEVDEGQKKVEDGRGDDKDGQLPGQFGQQVKGLVLRGERPNVIEESKVLFAHAGC